MPDTKQNGHDIDAAVKALISQWREKILNDPPNTWVLFASAVEDIATRFFNGNGFDRSAFGDYVQLLSAQTALYDHDRVSGVIEHAFNKHVTTSILGEWDAGEIIESQGLPEPRSWLLGNHFCRGFVSTLFAAGGVGKSALRLLQFICMATNRGDICGQHVFQRCKVLLISLEDDAKEARRRIIAVLQHHNVAASELKGWLWVANPLGKRLVQQEGKWDRKMGDLEPRIRAAIAKRKPDIIGLDPFVKLHNLSENDATDMNLVCEILVGLASEFDIAVDVPHHVHKGMVEAGDADAGRGSSGIKDAGRLNYTLTVMSKDEAKQYDKTDEERFQYVRLDRAKVNITARGAPPEWFKIVPRDIGNKTERYPKGDSIQVVETWVPPDVLWAGGSHDQLNRILDALDAGLLGPNGPTGERYSAANAAGDRAAWKIVKKFLPEKTERSCRDRIKLWLDKGVLEEVDYQGKDQKRPVKGLKVNNAKRPGKPLHDIDEPIVVDDADLPNIF